MKLELISFALCPYVQRSVITLKHKKADFELTYIDLKNKPQWFLEISPMGKVPVLRVGGHTSIFESAVINEFLDETVGTPLMPKDPIRRALERAWIQFGSDVLMTSYQMTMARQNEELEGKLQKFFSDLGKVRTVLSKGPFFRGTEFSLVDAAWAPLFMRVFLSKRIQDDPRWSEMPEVRKWGEELLKLESVQQSVTEDFTRQYLAYCQANGSLLYS